MDLSGTLSPNQGLAQGLAPARSQAAARADVAPVDELAPVRASVDASFARVYGEGGAEARAAVAAAVEREGPVAYDRLKAAPESFGAVVGARSEVAQMATLLEALDYSRAVQQAGQEGREATVRGYGPGSTPAAAPRSEASQPEASQPEASQPEASQPEASQPEASQSEAPGEVVPRGVVGSVREDVRTAERAPGGDGASEAQMPEHVSGTHDRESVAGHEYDAETGTTHTGAQYYMLDSGQRVSVDPQVSRTASVGQLDYELDESASYTGPVGPSPQHIVIAKGLSDEQVLVVLGTMQSLTDDRIVYDTQPDGSRRVRIASLGEGDKTAGTRLIRRLNSSDQSVTVPARQ